MSAADQYGLFRQKLAGEATPDVDSLPANGGLYAQPVGAPQGGPFDAALGIRTGGPATPVFLPNAPPPPVSSELEGVPFGPPPPPAASGPTEMAPVTVVGSPTPKAAPAGAGFGGYRAAVDKAYREQDAAENEAMDLHRQVGASQMAQREDAARAAEEAAAKKAADAEIERKEQAQAHARFMQVTDRNLQLADEVASTKRNPNRLLQNMDTGDRIMFMIAIVLGGADSAANGGPNKFFQTVDRMIDRDVDAQQADLEAKKSSLESRKAIAAQLMQESGDARVGREQFRNMVYESMKQTALARAERIGLPEVKAKAELLANAITQEQKKRHAALAEHALKQAQAQAAAAAAARIAAEERKRKADIEERETRVKEFNAETERAKAQAEKAGKDPTANFVATGQDKDGNPTGYMARSPEEAQKHSEGRAATETLLAKIENAKRIRNETGLLGRTVNRNDPNQLIQLYTPQWQTQLRSLSKDMLTDWSKAKHLGSLDKGVQELASDVIGDLESRGSSSDERLDQLAASLRAALDADKSASGGQRAVKVVDPATGKATLAYAPSFNAPRPAMPSTVQKK